MTTQTKEQLFARTTTPALLGAALLLDSRTDLTTEERLTRAWLFDEIEQRAGGITMSQEEEFERVYDATDSYLQALLYIFPALESMS